MRNITRWTLQLLGVLSGGLAISGLDGHAWGLWSIPVALLGAWLLVVLASALKTLDHG